MADEQGLQGAYNQTPGYDQGGTSGYPSSYDQSVDSGYPHGGYGQGGYEQYGAQPAEAEGGMSYVKSLLGILKIGEIVCIYIVFIK